jgi:hypothetical protein
MGAAVRKAWVLVALLTLGLFKSVPLEAQGPTIVYLVRHAEVDFTQPTAPLSTLGRARAQLFARTVANVRFTHVFSSHTTRARQMVEAVARENGLELEQYPTPGMEVNNDTISDRTPSRRAVVPLLEAIRAVPEGSSVLVGANSDNIFAILHGLGVPVATDEDPCDAGETCVPCETNECFPPEYDRYWVLVAGKSPAEARLIDLRFGAFQ